MAIRTAKRITRGELARRTGVNRETILYFERIGVLAAAQRTEGGHRIYDEGHVRTLDFICRARGLGFSPEEVRAIVALGGPGKASCAKVRDIASHHLEQVRAKISQLIEMERLLTMTINHCSGRPESECAVVDMIENPGRGRRQAMPAKALPDGRRPPKRSQRDLAQP